MLKVADKVSRELHANEEFKKELNSCVWSELIEPKVFELSWDSILIKYNLIGEPWFKSMFEWRKNWVPAYFRDFPMSGLVRTTSISECENSFFKRYTRYRENLIEFWLQYNNALDVQRQNNSRLNYINSSSVPTFITKLHIEKHAGFLYTFSVFLLIQDEIISAYFNCQLNEMRISEDLEGYVIEDEFHHICLVKFDAVLETYTCKCKLFCRKGFLCRYVFFVFKNKDIRSIPEQYIVRSWLKSSLVKPVHDCMQDEDEKFVGVDEKQILADRLTSTFFGWLQKFDGDSEKMALFLDNMNDAGAAIMGSEVPESSNKCISVFEEYYGGPVPETIEVRPPKPVKIKGSGRHLISNKEKAIREMNKPLRQCKKCMKWQDTIIVTATKSENKRTHDIIFLML